MRTAYPLLLGLVLVAGGALTARAESASVLLEKAVYAEETVGDLDKAVTIYRQIVEEHQASRRTAAEAQYRLGMCLLKKRRHNEAAAAFEKLVKEFADQAEFVKKAREQMPAEPFPEIVGCRLKERLSLRLEPVAGGAGAADRITKITTHEYVILDIAWELEPALKAKAKGMAYALEKTRSDSKDAEPVRAASSRSYGDGLVTIGGPDQPQEVSAELRTGEYLFSVRAFDVEAPDNRDAHTIAQAQARITVKALPYTQISVNDMLSDGRIQFRSITQERNDQTTPRKSLSFVSSDFVRITKMTDDSSKSMEFTAKHEDNHYCYDGALNEPVKPGDGVLYASEGTVEGLIDRVAGGQDEFRFQMQHWPSTNQPTRRIEVYRLPGGAELLETNPADMPRRVVQGRTELFVEKIIPPQGSITTSFRYRLRGAELAKDQPLKPAPAPWTDGEEMRLRIWSGAGADLGQIVYWAESVKAGQRDAWRVRSSMIVEAADLLQATRVDAERDSFAPISGMTVNTLSGRFDTTYEAGKAELESVIGVKKSSRTVPLERTAYDNEQAIYLIRRLPLKEGYRARFPIFAPQGGVVLECRIDVTAREKVRVPHGEHDCHKMSLSVYAGEVCALTHQLWFSADAHRYLVKYDAGTAVMELVEVTRRPEGGAMPFTSETPKLSLVLPVEWRCYRSPGAEGYRLSLQMLPPELEAWCRLTVGERRRDDDSVRKVAESEIERVKGALTDYEVRSDGWTERVIGGLPAVSYLADYRDKVQDKVEYRTYVLGKSMVYWFVFRADKDRFDALRPQLDAIVISLKPES